MKHKTSVALEEKTLLAMRSIIRKDTRFRNKSHLMEFAIHKLLEDLGGDSDE